MGTINRRTVQSHLYDYQLSMLGKTRVDVADDDRFFFNNTMTYTQFVEFKKYAIPLLQKIFKCRRTKAEEAFYWWRQQYGVRIKGL